MDNEIKKIQPSKCDISIVVPIYKEEKNIRPFLSRMEPVLERLTDRYEIIFALDPSPDLTEAVVLEEIERNPSLKLMVFSRRFGQPAATMAGIEAASGDIVGVIDVDLQDPPELLENMVAKMREGFDVVYAQRRTRAGETLVKKIVSYIGYAVINRLSEVPIPRNTGDFRIMSRRVANHLVALNEGHGFLRGLVAFVGFPQAAVQYDRDARFSGIGNYNRLTGSLKIGINGLVSFSSRPLQLMSIAGAVLAFFSFVVGALYVLQKLFGYELTPGLPTTVLVVTFFSGVQLLSLGLLGEYVGRIYDEVKRRPPYILEKKVNFGIQQRRPATKPMQDH
jgi:glycosyltransferase involved in cell wall biosynthesis